jgi:predicted Rossmann fold nucleotide-binding protein DprA/Smf involved in DNA uptake
MNVKKLTVNNSAYPSCLQELAQPPAQLFVQSDNWKDLLARPRVAVIGSRKVSAYGLQASLQASWRPMA